MKFLAALISSNYYLTDKQKWSNQVREVGGVIPTLNKRLFIIKRLKNCIEPKALKKVAESLYMSKMRYGIQLMGKIRWAEEEKMSYDLKAIQTTFNKLARLMCNVTLRDRIPTQTLFDTLGWLSFNQLNAQVKLNEAWKMENIQDYIGIPFENLCLILSVAAYVLGSVDSWLHLMHLFNVLMQVVWVPNNCFCTYLTHMFFFPDE